MMSWQTALEMMPLIIFMPLLASGLVLLYVYLFGPGKPGRFG